MKKIISSILAIATLVAFVSCKKDTTPTYTVTVKVAVDSTYPVGAELPVFTVKMTNTSGGAVSETVTENGTAVFSGVYSGVYTFNAAAVVTLGDVTFNLSASFDEAKSILKDETINMIATATKSSNLIFKEIYQSGCKIGSGEWDTYFRDQYYEIYNNGTETVYADSLCIANCVAYNYDDTKYVYDIANPEKYVFVQVVWQIQGNGKEYPINPGESIVIAQLATNHTECTDSIGSPVNLLSVAEFEAMNGDKKLWDGTILPDGPALNMKQVIVSIGYSPQQWLTPVGNTSMVIFKPSKPLENANFIQCTNFPYSTYAVREVLREDILDGVNILSDETRTTFCILPAILDAGYIWHSAPGSYTGESISRKIASTRNDGTIVYQDTNNTCDDFVLNKTPEVRRNGAKMPEWHNWN